MKLKIKVKYINPLCGVEVNPKGEWVDLRAGETVIMQAPQAMTLKKHKVGEGIKSSRDVEFDFNLIPLGVAMKLPKGYEAIMVPRSSTFKTWAIIQANSQGIIDSSYSGNNDEWKFPAIALKDTTIFPGEKICQFRIQLSQKATAWQKIKNLFYSGIKFIEVDSLDSTDRGGFGTTGVK